MDVSTIRNSSVLPLLVAAESGRNPKRERDKNIAKYPAAGEVSQDVTSSGANGPGDPDAGDVWSGRLWGCNTT